MGILTKIMSRRDDAVSDREFTVMSAVFFIIAAVVVLLNAEVAGALAFVTAICALLIFFSDTSLTLPPFMFLCIFVTRLHDAYDLFIPYVWMAAPVIISVAFHLIYYRKLSRPLFGKSIYGIAAVAVAVTLGGVGKITAEEYFAPAALYHTLGLGLGMIPLYVILRACYSRPGSANRIVSAMYLSGFFAAFAVIRFYAADLSEIISGHSVYFQSSNNLSLFLMLAMPFACLYTLRRPYHFLSLILFYVCILLSGSRGGLVMGTTEFFLISLFFLISDKKNRPLYLAAISAASAALLIFAKKILVFYGLLEPGGSFFISIPEALDALIIRGEARTGLLERSVSDFLSNPLFGRGIGYRGNEDLYAPVRGAANWYHMWLPQIIGSMGLIGVAAYFFQLLQRIYLYLRSPSLRNSALFLSYAALLLMSQVNPGEFCPLPFSMLAVLFFSVIERGNEAWAQPRI